MNIQDILKSTSFAALDIEGQRIVRESVQAFFNRPEEGFVDIPLIDVLKQKQTLLTTLHLYEKQLATTQASKFAYLSTAKKGIMEENLFFTLYLLIAIFQLEKARGQNVDGRIAQIKKCADLLNELHNSPKLVKKKSPEILLQQQVDESEKPLKYIGLTMIAPFILRNTHQFLNTHEKNVQFILNDLNQKRRYWLWAGGLLTQVFEALSTRFYHTEDAQEMFQQNNVRMNYLSWMVLYARWGIMLGNIGRHGLIGVTKEENTLTRKDRILAELHHSKYTLMQDTITIGVGLMCAFWATSSSPFAVYAAPLSVLLRLLSLVLFIRQYAEKNIEHEQQLLRFNHDIQIIEDKQLILDDKKITLENAIKALQLEQNIGENKELLTIKERTSKLLKQRELDALKKELNELVIKQIILENEIQLLYKNKRKYTTDWHLQENAILIEIGFATGLLTGVCMMTCTFFPPLALAPIAATVLNLTGISICFASMVTSYAFKGQEQVIQSQRSHKSLTEECAFLLLEFNLCKTEEEKKLLYLDMKLLQAQSEYQQQMVTFQKMKLIHAIVIQALLPAAIFTALVFMPAAGIALIGVGLLIAFAAEQYLNRYKPQAIVIPEFDETEYQTFAQNPTIALLKTHSDQNSSLKNNPEQIPNITSDESDDVELTHNPVNFEGGSSSF